MLDIFKHCCNFSFGFYFSFYVVSVVHKSHKVHEGPLNINLLNLEVIKLKNKFYMVLIGLIIIVAAVVGYFAFQTNAVPENRSAVMDKYILDGNSFDETVSAKRNQTNELAPNRIVSGNACNN